MSSKVRIYRSNQGYKVYQVIDNNGSFSFRQKDRSSLLFGPQSEIDQDRITVISKNSIEYLGAIFELTSTY